MSNTVFSSDLISQIAGESIPLLRPAMPPIDLYCTPLRIAKPVAAKVNVPIITSVQNIQTNPTSFENSNDSIGSEEPSLTHLSAQFGFANPEQNSGLELRLLLASHLTKLEQEIQTTINAVITEANYASAVVTVS